MKKDVTKEVEKLEIQEGDTLAGFAIPFFQAPNDIFGQGIPPHQLVIYLYFCRVGNQGASIFPGMRKIAEKCNMDKGTVDRSIKSLVNAGWLVKTKQFDEVTGAKKSNLYHLNIPINSDGDLYAENVQGVYAESVQGGSRERTYKEPRKNTINNIIKNKDNNSKVRNPADKIKGQKWDHMVQR